MCDRCGEPGIGRHGISITERPAHRLVGLMWEGTFEQASMGALRPLLARMKAVSDRQSGLWRSPIVALSWSDRPGGFRHFVGIDADDVTDENLAIVDLPEMKLANSWHGSDDGDVIAHYGGMAGWMRENALKHDRSVFDQREEYPPDVDLSLPPALRLMLPVA